MKILGSVGKFLLKSFWEQIFLGSKSPERTHALTHYPLMYNTYFVSLIFLLLSLFASVQSYLSDFSLVSMEGTHVQIFTTTLSASVQS
jgi:hypothetical protein